MTDFFDYLSGNVPGGFGLYVLLIIVISVTLWQISRSGDLFTGRHLKITLPIIWVFLTGIYAAFWFQSPPPQALHRYSTFFYSADSANQWLAYYFRDEIGAHLKPYRSYTDYHFKEPWRYLTRLDVRSPEEPAARRLITALPIDELLIGEVRARENLYQLQLKVLEGREVTAEVQFEIDPQKVGATLPGILNWIQQYFPVAVGRKPVWPGVRQAALVREYFYRGEYQRSQKYCEYILNSFRPDSPVYGFAKQWNAYNRIQLAAQQRLEQTGQRRNPYSKEKTAWQKQLSAARADLIPLAKTYIDQSRNDPMLNRMIAESFVLEGLYNDAEDFLKMAYAQDPFDIFVLENLSYLHPSRYRELPFRSEEGLLKRIVEICPLYEKAVTRYAEMKLLNASVKEAPAVEVNKVIERLLAINPYSVNGLILKGKYLTTIFDYQNALKAFEQADSLQPNSEIIHYNLGVVYFKLKQFGRAEQHFRKAVELGDFLDAHLYLGVIHQERGEFEKALKEFRYRVANKKGDNDYYAVQAMKGIRECLDTLKIPIPQ